MKCRVKDTSTLFGLIYNMILVTVCTGYAFKTRKIPENYNESKFIGFTMYTTCIIWLAFIPIYYGTGNSFEVGVKFMNFFDQRYRSIWTTSSKIRVIFDNYCRDSLINVLKNAPLFQIQMTTLCVSISLSAYVTLFCLFSPKIYIIIFHPDKNIRKLTMNSNTYRKPTPSSGITYFPTSSNPGNDHRISLATRASDDKELSTKNIH